MARKKTKSSRKPLWKRQNPRRSHKKLSPAQKRKAKKMAQRAGRRYPNMVDNARVARGSR
jgi:hypothetical protein